MLNWIWLGLILGSIIFAAFTGTLGEVQRAIYDSVRAGAQSEVVRLLDKGGSVLAALEALLRLRQACCHPSLVPGQDAESSSKLDVENTCRPTSWAPLLESTSISISFSSGVIFF